MNIAIFASAFHPSLGGVEELVRQLAHALHRAGHRALIVTERWPRDLPAHEKFEGLDVYRFALREPIGGPLGPRLRSQITATLTRPGTHRAIAQLLLDQKIELVHVQCVSPGALYAGEAARRLELPFVVTLQGELTMDATQLYQRSEAARRIMRNALTDADAITACSGQTLREAEEFMGAPFGERGRVVYNGIRLRDFEGATPYPHPNPFILGIGRHVPQKGFDVLLRAYALARAEFGAESAGEDARFPDLLLAGSGPQHEEFKALAAQLELGESASFVGRVDRCGAVALFTGCSFFVLPSRHEPMGIVNLEAMAAGRAVVASHVGGVPELVKEGENGLLVAPDDARALADALLLLVRDPDLKTRLGRCGAQRAQNFDWDAIAAQYLDVYNAARRQIQTEPKRKS